MPTQKKIDTVSKLSDKLSRAKSVVLTDYRGLKHKQLEELRRSLKKVNGEFVITKNRLLQRALGDQAKTIDASFTQTTAALFSFDDEVAPITELVKFFKAAGIGKTKAGFLGKTTLSDADVTRLSQLPGREQLLGQLAGQLNAPIQGLHRAMSWNLNKLVWALNSIKDKKALNF